MNIHRFVLVCIAALGLLAILVLSGFYFADRSLLLHTVADDLNRSFFRLEREVQKSLQNGRWDEIQAILDESAAINNTVAEVSVSKNGQRIDVSSSRALMGSPVEAEYLPIAQLHDGLVKQGHSRFKSEFYYFDGASKRTAQLLIHVNESYVFGRLNQLALYFAVFILLLIAFLTTLVFTLVRRLLVRPLERVTQQALEASTREESCFIAELSELNHAISRSFQALRDQQQNLQYALDETQYLDGILRTVADINELLITSKNVKELVDRSSERLASIRAMHCAGLPSYRMGDFKSALVQQRRTPDWQWECR